MLNKGTYIQDTLKMLSKILAKMEGHTSKKKSVMRALKLSASAVSYRVYYHWSLPRSAWV